MNVIGFADIALVTEWEQGDTLELTCPLCKARLTQTLQEENKESLLISEIIKCPCGQKEWQIIR